MSERHKGYSQGDNILLTRSYLDDPSNVKCPSCGAGTIEVVDYVDPATVNKNPRQVSPDNEYTVLLYCHRCERGAALHLSYRNRSGSG
jgi:hypothetical protein